MVAQRSASVLVTYAPGAFPRVQGAAAELEAFGEVARLDTSLGAVAGCVIVTYFDVRSAERLLAEYQGISETFPPAAHDNRAVAVAGANFAKVALAMGGLGAFGEVKDVSPVDTDVVVEFFDVRAAQQFATAVGGLGVPFAGLAPKAPWPAAPAGSELSRPRGNAVFGSGAALGGGEPLLDTLKAMLAEDGSSGAWSPTDGFGGPQSVRAGLNGPAGSRLLGFEATAPAQAAKLVAAKAPKAKVEARQPQPHAKAAPADKLAKTAKAKRDKDKDVSQFDICPQMIAEGTDLRTTVMVRNLLGPTARQWFFDLLATCGLEQSYTFFYMPLKEHRNMHSGFAFVNFNSPLDVLMLFSVMKSSVARPLPLERDGAANPNKVPAVSYARFQGHDELTNHFQTSAVIHDQDPSKRPIFCRQNAPVSPAAAKFAEYSSALHAGAPQVDGAGKLGWPQTGADMFHNSAKAKLTNHADTFLQPAYIHIQKPQQGSPCSAQMTSDFCIPGKLEFEPRMAYPFGLALPEAGGKLDLGSGPGASTTAASTCTTAESLPSWGGFSRKVSPGISESSYSEGFSRQVSPEAGTGGNLDARDAAA